MPASKVMAEFVAKNTAFPTVGEVIAFVAVKGGLVRTTEDHSKDPVYENLKQFIREQKGRDFSQLEEVLDAMESRLEELFTPEGFGKIIFDFFRRILLRYIHVLYHGNSNFVGRTRVTEEFLIPQFFIPAAAFILKRLNTGPFSFVELDEMLRSESPLKVAFRYPLDYANKEWSDLAAMYEGKNETYGSREADHDIEDNKKLIRKWGIGDATPDMLTCLLLLDELDASKYSGIVMWVWIGRFLQKVDRRYRIQIADAIDVDAKIPEVKEFAAELSIQNEKAARRVLGHKEHWLHYRLDALLFQNNARHLGDRNRVADLLKLADELHSSNNATRFHATWARARYNLFDRDFENALISYEQAFYEAMYGDSIAENLIIREWAAVAQQVGKKAVLNRINSRMKFFRFYPASLTEEEIVQIRLGDYRYNFGSGRFFVEAFQD